MKIGISIICFALIYCQSVYSNVLNSGLSKRQQINNNLHDYGNSYYINNRPKQNNYQTSFTTKLQGVNPVIGIPPFRYQSMFNYNENIKNKIATQMVAHKGQINSKDIYIGDTTYIDNRYQSGQYQAPNNIVIMTGNTIFNVSDLARKIQIVQSDVFFNTGGCDCKNLICMCCNLVDSLSKTPNCFELKFLNTYGEFQVKQDRKVLGKNKVQNMKDICNAEQTFCIHFYNLVVNPGTSVKGCCDLKIKNGNLSVKIGCYYMDSGLDHYINRQFISKHQAGKIYYNYDRHPIEQNEFAIETLKMNKPITNKNNIYNGGTLTGSYNGGTYNGGTYNGGTFSGATILG